MGFGCFVGLKAFFIPLVSGWERWDQWWGQGFLLPLLLPDSGTGRGKQVVRSWSTCVVVDLRLCSMAGTVAWLMRVVPYQELGKNGRIDTIQSRV